MCGVFVKDDVEEMMRNASCFVVLFLVKHFFKEASKSTPLFCTLESP